MQFIMKSANKTIKTMKHDNSTQTCCHFPRNSVVCIYFRRELSTMNGLARVSSQVRVAVSIAVCGLPVYYTVYKMNDEAATTNKDTPATNPEKRRSYFSSLENEKHIQFLIEFLKTRSQLNQYLLLIVKHPSKFSIDDLLIGDESYGIKRQYEMNLWKLMWDKEFKDSCGSLDLLEIAVNLFAKSKVLFCSDHLPYPPYSFELTSCKVYCSAAMGRTHNYDELKDEFYVDTIRSFFLMEHREDLLSVRKQISQESEDNHLTDEMLPKLSETNGEKSEIDWCTYFKEIKCAYFKEKKDSYDRR